MGRGRLGGEGGRRITAHRLVVVVLVMGGGAPRTVLYRDFGPSLFVMYVCMSALWLQGGVSKHVCVFAMERLGGGRRGIILYCISFWNASVLDKAVPICHKYSYCLNGFRRDAIFFFFFKAAAVRVYSQCQNNLFL